MNVNGIVIAASEVIKFEKGQGVLLTICNLCMNIYFYILIKDKLLDSWKKVHVNHFYKFFHLKVGAIEWLSGTKVITFLTFLDSKFEEISEHEQKEVILSSVLLNKLSIPAIIFNPDANSERKIISYQGVITKVHSSDVGIFELDNRIHLYSFFNLYRSSLPVLKQGYEVFISNVHYFTDFRNYKILVCCGLSSIKPTVLEVENNSVSSPIRLSDYPLSIFDLIWLEILIAKLNAKFYPSIVLHNFSWKDKIIENILACFADLHSEQLSSNRSSLGEEYCSNPHACNVFKTDILPTGCVILNVSDILSKMSSKVYWSEVSDNWKTCHVNNEAKYILIGMLYLSKDGCWYIMDSSCDIPIIFTKTCSSCEFPTNMFCLFDNLNLGYLIALQNFCVVYEKIKYDCDKYMSHRYIKTSCCYLFHLGTFLRKRDDLFNFVQNKCSPLKPKEDYFVEEITESLKNTHLNELDAKVKSPCNSEDFENNCINQHVLVLNKIWTISNQTFMCYQVLALLLPEELVVDEVYFDKSKSLCNDTFDFYGTNDDQEFVELINQIDSLFLESKPRVARLHFESIKQCALMFPGHIYSMELSESFIKDVKLDRNSSKPVLIKIKTNMKVQHSLACKGEHHPDDYDINIYHNITDLITNRKTQENVLIRAVLKDKRYEDNVGSSASQSELEAPKTLCLILKDQNSEDTLKMYLPFCPRNMFGFLPGTHLQIWGFVCICSRRGQLYLTPSSSFGIQIINTQPFELIDNSLNLQDEPFYSGDKLRFSTLQRSQSGVFFKCICFIVKIISAKVFLVCNNCGKDFEKKCSCFCSYNVKLKLSFIIEDGTGQMLVYSSNKAARKVLMLDEKEWSKLSSFVTNTRKQLNFHYKNDENGADSNSSTEHAFNIYCSSKFLCRPTFLKCKKFGALKTEEQTAWCQDVLDTSDIDLIPELIIKVKGIKF